MKTFVFEMLDDLANRMVAMARNGLDTIECEEMDAVELISSLYPTEAHAWSMRSMHRVE
jgi:hypothetical protein